MSIRRRCTNTTDPMMTFISTVKMHHSTLPLVRFLFSLLPEVCDDGIQIWTVYDGQAGKGNMCMTLSVFGLVRETATRATWARRRDVSSTLSCFFVKLLIVFIVGLIDCVHNVNVPARGVRAVRGVLSPLCIPVKRSKVNLERMFDWLSWWKSEHITNKENCQKCIDIVSQYRLWLYLIG